MTSCGPGGWQRRDAESHPQHLLCYCFPIATASRPSEIERVMIRGLGTDIIEIVRVGEMLDKHGEHFLDRVYTSQEVSYCQARKAYLQHFAGRWAAKEAVMKAIGTGWSKGVGFKDIEVESLESGQPRLVLHGEARETADSYGVGEILITISHCRAYATATAVAMASVGVPTTTLARD